MNCKLYQICVSIVILGILVTLLTDQSSGSGDTQFEITYDHSDIYATRIGFQLQSYLSGSLDKVESQLSVTKVPLTNQGMWFDYSTLNLTIAELFDEAIKNTANRTSLQEQLRNLQDLVLSQNTFLPLYAKHRTYNLEIPTIDDILFNATTAQLSNDNLQQELPNIFTYYTLGSDLHDFPALQSLYSSSLVLNYRGNPYYNIAKSWDMAKIGSTWNHTIVLSNSTYSDGSSITASDYMLAIRFLQATCSPYRLSELDKYHIEQIDNVTIQFMTNQTVETTFHLFEKMVPLPVTVLNTTLTRIVDNLEVEFHPDFSCSDDLFDPLQTLELQDYLNNSWQSSSLVPAQQSGSELIITPGVSHTFEPVINDYFNILSSEFGFQSPSVTISPVSNVQGSTIGSTVEDLYLLVVNGSDAHSISQLIQSYLNTSSLYVGKELFVSPSLFPSTTSWGSIHYQQGRLPINSENPEPIFVTSYITRVENKLERVSSNNSLYLVGVVLIVAIIGFIRYRRSH